MTATQETSDTGRATLTGDDGTGIRADDISVGEHTLHVNQVGTPGDPAILWLHGSGPGVSALSNWERLITRMPGYHHVAPDILGFGESDHPDPAPAGTNAYTRLRAQTTLALLDALELRTVHVVGNSMGGMIALALIGLAPERVDRIALMGSAGAPGMPTEALIQMVSYYQDPGVDSMRAVLKNFVHDTDTFGGRLEEIVADRVRKAGRDDVRRSHLATFSMEAGPPVMYQPEDLAAITHEALVVHGREDRVIPLEAGVYLSTHLPNAQLHVLPHAGHWVQIEQADRFRAQAELFFGEGR